MKRVQLFIGCDMTWAKNQTAVAADETVYLAFGTDPEHLQVRELDLSAEWAQPLREFIQPFLDASHAVGEMDVPGGTGKTGASAYPEDGSGFGKSVDYCRRMRAWADATGFTNRGNPPYHKHKEGGGYYHSLTLRRAYAAYLASVAERVDERVPVPA